MRKIRLFFICFFTTLFTLIAVFAQEREERKKAPVKEEAVDKQMEPTPFTIQETSQEKKKLEIKKEIIEKEIPSYTWSLKKLIKEAKKNIEKIDRELKKQKILEKKQKVASFYREALTLYREKKYKEAYQKFKKVEKLVPNYAQTAYYLSLIETIKDMKKTKENSEIQNRREKIRKTLLEMEKKIKTQRN